MPQDVKQSVRPVLFQTNIEEWPYSYGGSLFVVDFNGCCYGLTCKHVIRDEGINCLFVAPAHVLNKGMRPAPIECVAQIDDRESELQDISVICFTKEISPQFFGGTAYVIGPDTVGSSDTGDRLRVHGFLNTKTVIDIDAKSITGGYCDLEFRYMGQTTSDPFVRQAFATYAGHNFRSLDGISGAPVFNDAKGRLCGMAARGGLNDRGIATLLYIDIRPIIKLVEAVNAGSTRINFE